MGARDVRTYRVRGERIEALVEDLASRYGTEARRSWREGAVAVHLLVGNKYFLRTSSTATLVVLVHQPSPDGAEVFALATGAQSGAFGVTWGANRAYEAEFDTTFWNLVVGHGLTMDDVPPEAAPPEAPPPPPQEAPAEVRCPECGMRTSPDKGECYYCGTPLRRR